MILKIWLVQLQPLELDDEWKWNGNGSLHVIVYIYTYRIYVYIYIYKHTAIYHLYDISRYTHQSQIVLRAWIFAGRQKSNTMFDVLRHGFEKAFR